MVNRINSIKEKAKQIDIKKLKEKGKTTFYTSHFSEFQDSIGPAYILDETYTAYTDNNELVLECLKKYCEGISPDELTIPDEYFTVSRDIIYMKGKQITEIPEEKEMTAECEEIYRKSEGVITRANKREELQKQYIKNFFRRLFNRNSNYLLNGNVTSLSEEDLIDMIESISNKSEKFMNKYNTEKSEADKIIDNIEEKQVTPKEKDNDKTR